MKPELCFFPDPEAMSRRAASIFMDEAAIAAASKGTFTVAVSGGTTPLRFFELLASKFRGDVPWDRVHIFWVDERCVSSGHEDSNYKGAHEAFLSEVDIPPENIHRIKGELSPDEGAREYEEELRRYFGRGGLPVFDLVVLGVGEDGHTASLFPDGPSLSETGRLAIPVYVNKMRSWRITLTLPVLNNASHILFLVTGRKKALVLKEILENDVNNPKYPASLIRPFNGKVTWLLDSEASSQLTAIS